MSLLRRLLRPKPNPTKIDFVIAGTQKGGTTALDHYLRSHPGLCMAARKEVHFFDEDRHFTAEHRPRRAGYADYHALFPDDREGKVTGEATPIYMYWRDAPPRMREYRSDLRIILVLRNPIERAFSHWNMERQRGGDDLDFWTAITTEKERCRDALPRQQQMARRFVNERSLAATERFQEIAQQAGMSLVTLAIAWSKQHDFVASTIVGATTPEQMEDILAAADVVLEPEILKMINKVSREIPY